MEIAEKEEILKVINTYESESLFVFIKSGDITLEEMRLAGLHYKKQEEIKVLQDKENIALRREDEDWKKCREIDSEDAYNFYLDEYGEEGRYVMEARIAIRRIREKEKREMEQLLEDMRNNPTDYTREYLDRLYEEGKITNEILLNHDLITKRALTALRNKLTIDLPQPDWKDLPPLPEGKTDVYFFGVPQSGKSCALAGLLYEANKRGVLRYDSPASIEQKDYCNKYYHGLLDCIKKSVPPARTIRETANYMSFKLKHENDREAAESPVSLIEIGGEYFELTTKIKDGDADLQEWKEMGATQYLKNNNRKMLFFVIDYKIVCDEKNGELVEHDQPSMLENALQVFTKDGSGPKGENSCTMSKVDTVIIILTKSDLMGDISKEERNKIALEYLNENFATFMGTLDGLCYKYGINTAFDHAPIVTTFSLGRFMVGNTVEYNNTDSADLVEILKFYTRPERKVGLIPRLFARASK